MLQIKLDRENNIIPDETKHILDSMFLTTLEHYNFHDEASEMPVNWFLVDNKVTGSQENGPYSAKLTLDKDDNIQKMTVERNDNTSKHLFTLSIYPMTEMLVLSKLQSHDTDDRPASQLGNHMRLIQAMYQDDPDYSIDKPVPNVFFTKMDFDYYMAKLQTTLQESILLWMESNATLSVDMSSQDINTEHIPGNQFNVKRVYMHGPARNHVMVEFNDNTTVDFMKVNISMQISITEDILSILPEV
jgi:hypothetical protein